MGKFAQLVLGPAGVGKSTYCAKIAEHCAATKRRVHVVNLDPAAEDPLAYEPAIDVRELVRADEVAEQLGFGPNGALMHAMSYVCDNTDWLLDQLGDFEDDYLIVDCPGQLELYSHVPIMRTLVDTLQVQAGYRIVGLYLIDSSFLADPAKFVAGVLACLSAMVRLEVPHINVLSKMDLLRTALPEAVAPRAGRTGLSHGIFERDVGDEEEEQEQAEGDEDDDGEPEEGSVLERYTQVDVPYLMGELEKQTGPRFAKLNQAIAGLLDDYSMVSFAPLDITKRASIEAILREADNAIQFGEDEEPRDPDEAAEKDGDEFEGSFEGAPLPSSSQVGHSGVPSIEEND